jgi:hypothetical protein
MNFVSVVDRIDELCYFRPRFELCSDRVSNLDDTDGSSPAIICTQAD